MTWIRYILYFAGVAFTTGLLTYLETNYPGTLKLHIIVSESDRFGTSEYSPVEIIQPVMLALGCLLMAWVVKYCPSQRPVAIPFGGLALAFIIRELDYFLDRLVADNVWQVLVAVAGALVITYTYRQRKRMKIAWGRIWPSPGIALLFAGAVIIFAFVRLVGHEPLWMAILGEDYQRVVKLAVEEFIELCGYFLWLIGAIEYTYQAQAIAYREPEPAARRLRKKRRHDAEGRF